MVTSRKKVLETNIVYLGLAYRLALASGS